MCPRNGKKHGLLKALVLTGLVATTAFAAVGCLRHKSPEERAEFITNRVSSYLSLDESQKVKLNAVKAEFLNARAENREERNSLMNRLIAQIKAPTLDVSELQKLVDKKQDLVDRAAPKVLEKLATFHASLTQDQKAKLVEKIEEFRSETASE